MSYGALFNIGRTAMQAAQVGLQVAGNNIANVNNPHYCRQRVAMSPSVVVEIGGVPYTTGVEIDGVDRVYDAFLGRQLLDASSQMYDYDLRQRIYSRVESVLYPSEDSNLGLTIDDFFNAWHDLSGHPEGTAERTVVLARGEDMVQTIRTLYRSLEDEMEYSNNLLETYRDEINLLSKDLASLNEEILRQSGSRSSPNDLLDRQDEIVRELSQYMDLTTFTGEGGMVTVMAASGQPLVEGTTHFDLELEPELGEHNFYTLSIRGQDVTDNLAAGKLQAIVQSREITAEMQDDLDVLAAALTREINQVHAGGYGLDGVTGRDFFEPLQVTTQARSTNAGGAEVTLEAVADRDLLTYDRYEIRFRNGGTTYDIVNTTDGTTVASDQAYTSGANIEFAGMRVALSDGTGAPAEGDVFRMSCVEGAARDIAVALDETDHIAAAEELDTLPGDNRNAVAIARVREQRMLRGGTTTLAGHYQTMVGRIGTAAQDATRVGEAKEVLYDSMLGYRDAVSGVSLEEEEVKLMAYQHSYSAAAKFMSIVDEVLEQLVNL